MSLEKERARVLKRIRELRVEGGLSLQAAFCLLRTKTHGDATFLARACGIPPLIAQRLDEAVAQCVIELSGVSEEKWNRTARRRIFLPPSAGGLGLSSIELAAPGAITASWQANLDKIRQKLWAETVADLLANSPWFLKVQAQCSPALRQLLGSEGVNLGDAGISEFRKTDITKVRTSQVVEEILLDPAPEQREKAAFRSASGKGAGGWLGIPANAQCHLGDDQWRHAVCMRLDIDIPNHTGTCKHFRPDGSSCGANLDSKGKHARACLCQGWRVRRHESVAGVLADWCVWSRAVQSSERL